MDPTRRGICSYKFVKPPLKTLRGLGARLVFDNKDKFKKAYGNLIGMLNTKVNTMAFHALVQFYDPPLRCFTFQDYHLVPTLEEYSHILGIEIQDQVPFVRTKELPKSQHLAEVLHTGKKEMELNLKPKGGTHGFSLKFLVDKVVTFAEAESWDAFNTIFTLIIYGIVLLPNMEDFVDLVSIYLFMAKNHIPTLLDETYYSIHVMNEKKKGTIGPFVDNEGNLKWSQRIMSLTAEDISWYYIVYDDVKIILDYGNFPNVPLLGIKGGINYNPRLALCQLGYQMLDKPNFEQLEEFVLYEGVGNSEFQKRIIRAWREIHHHGRAELGKKNCIVKEAYTQWVQERVKQFLFPFPYEPSMTIKHVDPVVVPISEVDELKGIIKLLEKENVDLRSNIGKLALEKENLKFNLNQKRDRAVMTTKEIQEEQHKRRKVGEALMGTYESLSLKKKQLVVPQYKVFKTKINCQDQLKKLQSQLETCQKELKEERSQVKKLEVSLSHHQSDLDKRFEEIRELKGQAHKNFGGALILTTMDGEEFTRL
ncbi:uncharacterized protein LOC127131551 [Lathyrus oleraceus]|uniref:uncharacterized protein LOC127131551 n=1 Tax=Pisum sativum TaxID=3888 RepID=UPI0021D2CC7B|nr:uncharacterized protein LOC127131551 [Pisum sativum]